MANVAGHRIEETNHPCYQAWSYKVFLENMLDTVSKNHLHAFACAYLHNYKYKGPDNDPLAAEPNRELVESAPLFGRDDRDKLGNFISQHVGRGDGDLIMELLASGQVVPSKRLVDAVGIMFDENNIRMCITYMYKCMMFLAKYLYNKFQSTATLDTMKLHIHSIQKFFHFLNILCFDLRNYL